MNKKLHQLIDNWVWVSNVLRKNCIDYLSKLLEDNGNKIEWDAQQLGEFVCVSYDGGNHPEYASNVFSTVYGVFFDKEKNIYLKTEDCDRYYICEVTTDGLVDLVNFLDTYTEEIGIK